MLKSLSGEAHLSAELVCSFAGRFAASPPAADPCRRCGPAAAAPGGTRLPTAHENTLGGRRGTGQGLETERLIFIQIAMVDIVAVFNQFVNVIVEP